ncbi:MAG: hypothetical protein LBL74_02870 [Bacteroidales bacterium]|nr:hypothetical protein [Bacteroidales bacterium]
MVKIKQPFVRTKQPLVKIKGCLVKILRHNILVFADMRKSEFLLSSV